MIVGIGNTPVSRDITHARVLGLLTSQTEQYRITFLIPQTAELPAKSITIEDNDCRIGILTEGQDGNIVIVNLVVNGQGHKQGCELNDIVVGINDISLNQLMEDTCSCNELNTLIAGTKRPFTVNLNTIADPKQANASQPRSGTFNVAPPVLSNQIGPPISDPFPESNQENQNNANIALPSKEAFNEAKKPHPLSKIASMVRTGIEVVKIHNNPSMFNDSSADRVLWMDDRLTMLYCASEKGHHTSKQYPLRDIIEIKNPGNRPGKECRFSVVHKTGILELEVCTQKARNAVASNLNHLVMDRKNTLGC